MVFVRVRDEPPLVEVFSPVLTQVDENPRLYQRLSELTHRMPIGRFPREIIYAPGRELAQWALNADGARLAGMSRVSLREMHAAFSLFGPHRRQLDRDSVQHRIPGGHVYG